MTERTYEDYLNAVRSTEITKELKSALSRISEFEKALSMAVAQTKAENHRIFNLSDYDTDGIMSALILNQVYDIDKTVIADRYNDGYGIPNDLSFLEEGDLVILSDIGSDSIDKLKEICERTKTTPFVIDHHEQSAELKDYLTGNDTVKPLVLNFYDGSCEKDKEPDYCSAGLCYRMALANGNLSYRQKQLVCTYAVNGTIGDVVKVNSPYDTNREDIQKGFKTIENLEAGFEPRYGYLLHATGLTKMPHMTTESVQFNLSPVTTLGKRMEAMDGVKCNVGQKIFDMLKPDKDWETNSVIKEEYHKNAKKLIDLNAQRKKEVKSFEGKPFRDFISKFSGNIAIYSDAKKDIPMGYVGLIAMDLAKQLKVPSLVFTIDSNGDYVASGRNAEGYPDILKSCSNEYVKHIGGHTDAFGVTVSKENLEKYIKAVTETYSKITKKKVEKTVLKAEDLKNLTINKLIALEPFGTDFPKVEADTVITVGSKTGKEWNTVTNADPKDKTRYFGLNINGNENDTVRVKGTVSVNYFAGVESIQMSVSESAVEKPKDLTEDKETENDEIER